MARRMLTFVLLGIVVVVACNAELTTVIVTFDDNLPVSVGIGNSSAPAPAIAPVDVPNVTLVANLPHLGEAIYRGTSEQQNVEDICNAIMMYRNIETCEPDSGTVLDQTATPNDPLYGTQTYLNTTNTVALWQQGVFGNHNVRIGIIDSGVDLQNPELTSSLWTNSDPDDDDGVPNDLHCASFLAGVPSGDCSDANGHGTFVTGEIGAAVNNGLQIAGAVQQPTIIPCQYIDATGNGQLSDALLCFNWLASKNVQVISCSWGATGAPASLQQAVSKLSMAGIFISTSAGNNGISTDNSPQYPSAYSSTMSAVVGVAATDATGNLWSRSNYGNNTVQLAAPGVSIVGLGLGNTTKTDVGTSMESPLIPFLAV